MYREERAEKRKVGWYLEKLMQNIISICKRSWMIKKAMITALIYYNANGLILYRSIV